MSGLRSKVAIITGASAGIGEGIALHFASIGVRLSLTGRNVNALKQVEENCLELNVISREDILCTEIELTDDDNRKKLVENTMKKFGRIDILVNNAGKLILSNTAGTTPEIFDSILDINVRAHFFLTQCVIPHLKNSKGCIVNVGSMGGSKAYPGATPYCMSKAALEMFPQCLALELAPFDIRVNCVLPGVVRSMITRREDSPHKSDYGYAEFVEQQGSLHPLGRIGEPDDVAKAVAFLASDGASFISGDLMYIDGARHCTSN